MSNLDTEFQTNLDELDSFEEQYPFQQLKGFVDNQLSNLNTTYSAFMEKKRGEYHTCKNFKQKTKIYQHLLLLEKGYQVELAQIPKEWTVLPYSEWLDEHKANMIKKYGFKEMVGLYTALKETYVKLK